MVKNVKIQPSPAWMRERLRNSGVRPINNIVDITNYVMLEYGQPMHAFDFSLRGGRPHHRPHRPGGRELIQTLDGNQRKLTPSMLWSSATSNKPVCVAGVMGGANSEIVGDTADGPLRVRQLQRHLRPPHRRRPEHAHRRLRPATRRVWTP